MSEPSSCIDLDKHFIFIFISTQKMLGHISTCDWNRLCNDLLLMKSIVHLFIWKLFSGTGFHYFYSIWLNYIGAVDLNVCLCWIPFTCPKPQRREMYLSFLKLKLLLKTSHFLIQQRNETWIFFFNAGKKLHESMKEFVLVLDFL